MSFDKSILEKYNQGLASEEERLLVESWFDQYVCEDELHDCDILAMLDRLDEKVRPIETTKVIRWKKPLALVASLLLIIGISYYWIQSKSPDRSSKQFLATFDQPKVISPIIVLENNEEFSLDKLVQGDTLNVGDYLITRTENGEIKYIVHAPQSEIIYNTVRTKTGSTASLVLSDGTRVWLNVNSELRYPISFPEGKREIQLKGECYFEVEHVDGEAGRVPFYVRGDQYTVAVLGTKFNADFSKSNITALIDGRVSIAKGSIDRELSELDFDITLYPNQVYQDGKVEQSDNILEYIDWKEGYFNLSNRTLAAIAERLSAWYGLEVVVDKEVKDNVMFGRISRSKSLTDVLSVISDAFQIDYKIKNDVLYLVKAK